MEPLLEIFKEEPLLQVLWAEPLLEIPTATRQPLNDVILEPKPEPIDPIPEATLFCSLCLRPCFSGQVVQFSTESIQDCRDKLALILGLELEVEQSVICRPCWTMVETLIHFRKGCLKAATWKAQFSFGSCAAWDDWMSKENLEALDKMRKMVQKHVECIEKAEFEARNRKVLSSNVLVEEKHLLEEKRDLMSKQNVEGLDRKRKIVQEHVECAEKAEFEERNSKVLRANDLVEQKHLLREKRDSMENANHSDPPKELPKKPNATKIHTCAICSANYTSLYKLKEHCNKHLGIKPYMCRNLNCNIRFHATNERFIHEKQCKGTNSFELSVDQKSSEPPTTITATEKEPLVGLANHRQMCKEPVESPRLLRCPICAVEFLHSNHLYAHINTHYGSKLLKCGNENCSEHFYDNSELQRHSKICGKKIQTASKKILKVHKQKTRPKARIYSWDFDLPGPFICAICGQGFAYKSLIPHMKKNHPTL